MHNPVHLLMRSALRAVSGAALAAGLLVLGAGAANAQGAAAVESNSVAFGLLGPVGLIAVALGIVGMGLGVLRQRRKARAEAQAQAATGMAEAVLADEPPSRAPLAG
ncbi:hypothetical protein SAMN05421504_106377 [Amycolatopsis xylanica]|uniref:LPXTG-motif cell wall anchor domain-containing protein n=2 Tax=Amycolatopsis xylanica TaxID=589385 RepID=A0A1H3LWR8_9PSEU|nr:hypothetical protein SAMN05421504_106377 [Amycolatopsis xylanica]